MQPQAAPTQPGYAELCQIETAQDSGRLSRPGWLYVPWRMLWNLRHRGLSYTLRATFRPRITALQVRLGRQTQVVRTPPTKGERLELQPGEMVEVKSLEEILATLDDKGRQRGLIFTPEMRKHCGKRYRVFKRLELMYDEYHRSQRRLKNTVLLEDVYCEGTGIGCHRACFLYWREAWLRRVTDEA